MTTDDDESLLFEQQQDTTDWPIPRLFWEYGRDYRPLIAVALLASILSPIVSLVPTYLLKVMIDGIFLDTTPFSLPGVPGGWLPTEPRAQLLVSVGLIVSAAVTSTGLGWVRLNRAEPTRLRVGLSGRIGHSRRLLPVRGLLADAFLTFEE